MCQPALQACWTMTVYLAALDVLPCSLPTCFFCMGSGSQMVFHRTKCTIIVCASRNLECEVYLYAVAYKHQMLCWHIASSIATRGLANFSDIAKKEERNTLHQLCYICSAPVSQRVCRCNHSSWGFIHCHGASVTSVTSTRLLQVAPSVCMTDRLKTALLCRHVTS